MSSENNHTKTLLKRIYKFSGIVYGIIFFVVAALLAQTAFSTNEILINDGKLIVTGKFGTEWELEEIQQISFEEEIPTIKRRNGGFSFGSIKKGQFSLEEIGQGQLFIHTKRTPFLYIQGKDDFIIINSKNPDITREWFQNIEAAR